MPQHANVEATPLISEGGMRRVLILARGSCSERAMRVTPRRGGRV